MTFKLPENMTIEDLKWFSIWNKPDSTSLGDIKVSSNTSRSILDKWDTGRELDYKPPPVENAQNKRDSPRNSPIFWNCNIQKM